VYLAACDSGKRYIATVGTEMCASVWGIEAGQVIITYNLEGTPANCIEWSPSGKFLAFGLDSGEVAVVDLTDAVAIEPRLTDSSGYDGVYAKSRK
jgi:WD40 repeat protein